MKDLAQRIAAWEADRPKIEAEITSAAAQAALDRALALCDDLLSYVDVLEDDIEQLRFIIED